MPSSLIPADDINKRLGIVPSTIEEDTSLEGFEPLTGTPSMSPPPLSNAPVVPVRTSAPELIPADDINARLGLSGGVATPSKARPSLVSALTPPEAPVPGPVVPPRYAVTTPVSPQPAAVLPERGVVSDIAAAVGRELVDTAEMAGRVLRVVSPTESAYEPTGAGSKLISETERLRGSPTLLPSAKAAGQSWLRTAVIGGIESVIPSVAAGLPGLAAGAAIGSVIPGVGTAIGGLAGWVAFALGAGTIFGLSEYDRFKQEARTAGVPEGRAERGAVLSGLVEGGVEAVADIIGAKVLGLAGGTKLTQPLKNTIRGMLKVPLRTAAFNVVKDMPIEVGTEMIQNATENYLRRKTGIPTDQTDWQAAVDAVGPTMVMTVLFGLGGRMMTRAQRNQTYAVLSNGKATPELRQQAAREITDGLYQEVKSNATSDPATSAQYAGLALQWERAADYAVSNSLPINIDANINQMYAGLQVDVLPTRGTKPTYAPVASPPPDDTFADESMQKIHDYWQSKFRTPAESPSRFWPAAMPEGPDAAKNIEERFAVPTEPGKAPTYRFDEPKEKIAEIEPTRIPVTMETPAATPWMSIDLTKSIRRAPVPVSKGGMVEPGNVLQAIQDISSGQPGTPNAGTYQFEETSRYSNRDFTSSIGESNAQLVIRGVNGNDLGRIVYSDRGGGAFVIKQITVALNADRTKITKALRDEVTDRLSPGRKSVSVPAPIPAPLVTPASVRAPTPEMKVVAPEPAPVPVKVESTLPVPATSVVGTDRALNIKALLGRASSGPGTNLVTRLMFNLKKQGMDNDVIMSMPYETALVSATPDFQAAYASEYAGLKPSFSARKAGFGGIPALTNEQIVKQSTDIMAGRTNLLGQRLLTGPEPIEPTSPPTGKMVPESRSGGKTESGRNVEAPERNIPGQDTINRAKIDGNDITPASRTYKEGVSTPGNVWIRQSADQNNLDRVLLMQFSDILLNRNIAGPGVEYNLKLYSGTRNGYEHPVDFWEVPQWMAVASQSLPNTDIYVVRNPVEAVLFLNRAKYKTVAFSAMDVNVGYVQQIAKQYGGHMVVGGYVKGMDTLFADARNIQVFDKIDDFVKDEGYKFSPGTNYRHFEGTEVIPRLCLSNGCLFTCSFCDVSPHGEVSLVSPANIARQVKSFRGLNAKLIYVSDKTFGQAHNFRELVKINEQLQQEIPGFQGFIVQTTASQLLSLNPEFLRAAGIRYVEIGVESYNDSILKAARKPHDIALIDQATQRLRDNGVYLIPNIMVGLPGETSDTYQNTLDYLQRNRDIISHVNANYVAVYKGTDLAKELGIVPTEADMNENVMEKSWHQDPQLVREFAESLFRFGSEQLDVPEDQLKSLSAVKDVGKLGGISMRRQGITPEMRESVLATGVPMFRLAHARVPSATGYMSVEDVKRVAENFQLEIPANGPTMHVVDTWGDLPAEYRSANNPELLVHQGTKGFYDRTNNRIIIIAEHADSEDSVMGTLYHEIVGHYGLEKFLGPRLEPFFRRVFDHYSKHGLQDVARDYMLDLDTHGGRARAASEKIARISQTGEDPTLWQQFVTIVKGLIRQIFDLDINEDEIKVILYRSRQLISAEKITDKERGISLRYLVDDILPTKLGNSFRVDTMPSDEGQGQNMAGWEAWRLAFTNRNKNFGSELVKDLGVGEAIYSLPHWIAMKYRNFANVTDVQWDRQDKNNADRVFLLRNPDTNDGDNPYLTLKDTSAVDKILIWSDANGVYLNQSDDLQVHAQQLVGRTLTDEEVAAYHGWKRGMDRAVDYVIDRLRKSVLTLFAETPFANAVNQVVTQNVSPDAFQFEDPKVQDAFGKAILFAQQKFAEIDQRDQQLRALPFYVPHVRTKGDYVVRVFESDANGQPRTVHAERFDSKVDAEKARIFLVGKYGEDHVVKSEEKGTTEFLYQGVSVPIMEAFIQTAADRAAKHGEMTEQEMSTILDSMTASIDQEIMARGFRQHFIRRQAGQTITGYQEDKLPKIFIDYMSGVAGSVNKLQAAYDFNKALRMIDHQKQRGLFEYAVKYTQDMLRNADAVDRKIAALKNVPYAWYLMANFRMVAAQMAQNFMTAAPILSRHLKEWGSKGRGGTARILQAMQDVSRGRLGEEETRMLVQAIEQGETSANMIQELRGRIEKGWARQKLGKVIEVLSIPFAGMEKFNRKTSLLAAFRAAREGGQDYAEAFVNAKEFVRSTHYAYGQSNMPALLREGTVFSKYAAGAYTFRSFTHNYLLSMKHFATNAEGRLAFDVIGRSLAFLVVMGGITAVPFLDDILDELEAILGSPLRSDMRKTLKGIGGQVMSDLGMEGLPALMGVDLSGSMKIGVPGLGGGSSSGVWGVWGGLADKGAQTVNNILAGDMVRALESGSPTGLESPLKALRLFREGVRTVAGRPLLDEDGKPMQITGYDAFLQSLAFRPHKLAEVSKERRVESNVKASYADKRQEIYKRLRKADTPVEQQEIIQDVQKYNMEVMKYRGLIPPIRATQLKQAMTPERDYSEYVRNRGE